MSYRWIEPFAGAAACALRLVGGPGLIPPVAWMGGKRRYALEITGAMGTLGRRPAEVVLGDAGPWGWVWPVLLDPLGSAAVAYTLRGWVDIPPRELWDQLVADPPRADLAQRTAQWLWIQARSASGVPVWWDGWRDGWRDARDRPATDRGPDRRWPGNAWKQGSAAGQGPQPVGQRGYWRSCESKGRSTSHQASQTGGDHAGWRMGKTESRDADQQAWQKGEARGHTGGMMNPATIAERIEAIALAFEDVAVTVHHGEAGEIPPGPGCCYLDPPYVGATGYGWDCPREQVVELALSWAESGAVVAVSEAVPLEIPGWHPLELTREGCKPEWLTLSREPVYVAPKQRSLFEQGVVCGPVSR